MTQVCPPSRSATGEGRPILATAVQRHLGRLLKDAYAQASPMGDQHSDQLGKLLARLERALNELGVRDEEAFRSEFLTMVPRLQRFAMSLTKNATLADDLVQETLLRAWRSRSRFVAETNLGAWLFTIMRNAFYSAHRKASREFAEGDLETVERVASAPDQAGHLDLQDAQLALAKLPEPMRRALVLVAVDNLSYEEAAAVMQCRIGTVKSRVWRAREQLAADLGFRGSEVGADGFVLSVMNSGAR